MSNIKSGRKFGRVSRQRKALLRSLAYALVKEGRITTTEAKAKELRPFIERLITLGENETLATRRMLTARVGGETATKIVKELSPRFKKRAGGYTRITKLPYREKDGAAMAVIEFVE